MNDHSVFVVRCGSKAQQNQATRKLNSGNDKLKHKQSIEHDLNITEMIKCKELNSTNKNAKNSRKQRTGAGKRKWNLKQIYTNEERSTT